MSGLLPSSPDVSVEDDPEPRVIGLDSEDASDMLAALSSKTARSVLTVLHEEPATPSAIADHVDTSLQNVQYHLEKLERADLVEQVGTQYSEKGREMTLYGPADGPLVVFPGSDEDASGFKQVLRRVLGAIVLLGAVSAVIEAVAREWLPGLTGEPGVPSDDSVAADDEDIGDDAAETDDSLDRAPEEDAEMADHVEQAPDHDPMVDDVHWLVESVVELPPGLLFFLGGCLVLLVLVGLWYWQRESETRI